MPERQPQGIEKYLDLDVMSSDGHRLGVASKIIENRVTEVPEWLVVEAGLLGRKRLVVPLAGSSIDDNKVVIPYTSENVSAAPHDVDPDDGLTHEEEDALGQHFNLGTYTPKT